MLKNLPACLIRLVGFETPGFSILTTSLLRYISCEIHQGLLDMNKSVIGFKLYFLEGHIV